MPGSYGPRTVVQMRIEEREIGAVDPGSGPPVRCAQLTRVGCHGLTCTGEHSKPAGIPSVPGKAVWHDLRLPFCSSAWCRCGDTRRFMASGTRRASGPGQPVAEHLVALALVGQHQRHEDGRDDGHHDQSSGGRCGAPDGQRRARAGGHHDPRRPRKPDPRISRYRLRRASRQPGRGPRPPGWVTTLDA